MTEDTPPGQQEYPMAPLDREPRTLQREQLYEEVWTSPMRHLAKRYGLSDVGLGKLCRRHEIPTPPVGYWAKFQHGKATPRPPLPEISDPSLATIVIEQRPTFSEGHVRQAIPQVAVPLELTAPHPLVVATRKALRKTKVEQDGLVRPAAQGGLPISVARGDSDRALRILDALAKALEERGHRLAIGQENRTVPSRCATARSRAISSTTWAARCEPSRRDAGAGAVSGLAALAAILAALAVASTGASASPLGAPWPRHTIDAGLHGADGVRLGDADGDGDPDVATGWEESGRVRLYLNPGPRAVTRHWPAIDVGSLPGAEDAAIADVDGDGRADVVSAGAGDATGSGLRVHFAPVRGPYDDAAAWTTAAFPAAGAGEWMAVAVVDVDGDGRRDVVAGGRSTDGATPARVVWLAAPPAAPRDLAGWRRHEISAAGWIMSLEPTDMDGDGDLDLLVSDRRHAGGADQRGVRWLEHPQPAGDPRRPWRSHVVGARHEAMFLALADLDDDGGGDVVAAAAEPSALTWYERRDPSGRAWRPHAIELPAPVGRAKGVAAGDVDCDGQLDLVVSFERASQPRPALLWLAGGGARWRAGTLSGPIASGRQSLLARLLGHPEPESEAGIKLDRVELVDLDRDGDLDVLTTEENHGVRSAGLGVTWWVNPHGPCP